jgi:hypothetical protein
MGLRHGDRKGRAPYLFLVVGCLLAAGCAGKEGVKAIHGTVTIGGQTPDRGVLRFVPLEGTPGSAAAGLINAGQYRVDGRGGLPVGKYRVEVSALKKTGKRILKAGAAPTGEAMEVDETIDLAPNEYAGENSPLTVEVTANSDGQIDIAVPARRAGQR